MKSLFRALRRLITHDKPGEYTAADDEYFERFLFWGVVVVIGIGLLLIFIRGY